MFLILLHTFASRFTLSVLVLRLSSRNFPTTPVTCFQGRTTSLVFPFITKLPRPLLFSVWSDSSPQVLGSYPLSSSTNLLHWSRLFSPVLVYVLMPVLVPIMCLSCLTSYWSCRAMAPAGMASWAPWLALIPSRATSFFSIDKDLSHIAFLWSTNFGNFASYANVSTTSPIEISEFKCTHLF